MSVYLDDGDVVLHLGDCVEVMAAMEPESVDAVVCDPPYGLEFMGKEWDRLGDIGQTSHNGPTVIDETLPSRPSGVLYDKTRKQARGVAYNGSANRRCERCRHWEYSGTPCRCGPDAIWPNVGAHQARIMQEWHQAWATEALRVLKPGGHLLAFGGTRTEHRLTCAIEDAGFEIRDKLVYMYGSGFPKSRNVSRDLDLLVPPDARCACGPRSTRTAPDSPGGSRIRLDGGLLPPAGDSARAPSPSPADAPGRSRGDQRGDGPAPAPSSSAPGGETAHPSNGDSPLLSAPPSEGSRSSGSTPSGTASSTSPDAQTALRRTADRTPGTSSSGDGWASASALRNANIPRCPDCSGLVIPEGFGSALKPAYEPVVMARKPLSGTLGSTVLRHGTGALNVDGCRVGTNGATTRSHQADYGDSGWRTGHEIVPVDAGRWPANVVLDEEAAARLDAEVGERPAGVAVQRNRDGGVHNAIYGGRQTPPVPDATYGDTGGPSRFFYTSKASSAERDGASHPTVKPLALMRWLVRLVTPPKGTVLDPFAGSGTTLLAAREEGFRAIGIEREPEYAAMAAHRLRQLSLLGGVE